ncbi:hypothetical protein VNO77_33124 [Canavalia gladiata]|uniref:Uncharacterized protein n=1 Tax=Canavalia gladiata TaxID=3824 RepID=A0AAN9PY30_CANGL
MCCNIWSSTNSMINNSNYSHLTFPFGVRLKFLSSIPYELGTYMLLFEISLLLCVVCSFLMKFCIHFNKDLFGMLPGDMQGKGHLLSETNIAVSSLGILCDQQLLKIKQTD